MTAPDWAADYATERRCRLHARDPVFRARIQIAHAWICDAWQEQDRLIRLPSAPVKENDAVYLTSEATGPIVWSHSAGCRPQGERR